MVKCPYCNEETDSSKDFCVNCGKKLPSNIKKNKKEDLKEKVKLQKEKENIKKEKERLNKERNKIFKEKKELIREKELQAKQKTKSFTNGNVIKTNTNSPPYKKQPSTSSQIKNKIVRLGIIFITLLVILSIVIGALTFTGYLSFDEQSVTLSNPQEDYNIESISESDSQSESGNDISESDNLLSFGSTKNVNFDGLFTMDVDKDRDFESYQDLSENYCEKHWYAHEDTSKGETPIQVYYWLNDKDYDFYTLDHYNGPENDGNIFIYTFKLQYSEPQGCEYMVFVSNGDETVAIQGADLDTLKNYANSVKF